MRVKKGKLYFVKDPNLWGSGFGSIWLALSDEIYAASADLHYANFKSVATGDEFFLHTSGIGAPKLEELDGGDT